MQRRGYTRAGFALSLAAAISLGYIAYLQYRLGQVDSIIAKTLTGAQKVAKEAAQQAKEGKEIAFNVDELEKKGWVLSPKDKTMYEYKVDGKVHAMLKLDTESGKVLYQIDCGSFSDEFAKQECSDALDGTGKNYVDSNDVPW